jgi:hypothetical protein
MFSKTITNSSGFLMMPSSSQALYFHLSMNADDDGFCEHFSIMRMTESKPDDLQILHSRGFVYVFDTQVLVVSDWKENNFIRPDRYTKSKYLEQYKSEIMSLSEIKNGNTSLVYQRYTSGRPRLGKVRDSIDKEEKSFHPACALDKISEDQPPRPDEPNYGAIDTAFKEFIAMRKEKKKPLTKISIDRLIAKLNKYNAETAIKMIEQSIEHGWTGIFEVVEVTKNKNVGGTVGRLDDVLS